MIKTIVCLVFAALLLFSLQVKTCGGDQSLSQINSLENLLGKNALEKLQQVDRIALFFVSPVRAFPHYVPISPEFLISKEMGSELQQLLLNDAHYVHGLNKLTMFFPTIAFKFNSEKTAGLIVLLSQESDQLMILDGEKVSILDYDPAKVNFDHFIQKIEIFYPQNQ